MRHILRDGGKGIRGRIKDRRLLGTMKWVVGESPAVDERTAVRQHHHAVAEHVPGQRKSSDRPGGGIEQERPRTVRRAIRRARRASTLRWRAITRARHNQDLAVIQQCGMDRVNRHEVWRGAPLSLDIRLGHRRWNQTGKNFIFRSSQTASVAPVTSFFETDVEFKLVRSIGDTIIRVRQTQPNQVFSLPVKGAVSTVQVDPNQWILNKVGTIAFDANLVSGVKEANASKKVNLFPNPATESLQISGLAFTPEKYQILDASGRVMAEEKMPQFNPQISVNKLAPGMYFLKLSNAKEVITKPFQKQ